MTARVARITGSSVSLRIATRSGDVDAPVELFVSSRDGDFFPVARAVERSADAKAMRAGYRALRGRIDAVIRESLSGRELAEAGFAVDVDLAVEEDVSTSVPLLRDGAYHNAAIATPEADRRPVEDQGVGRA